MIAHDSGIVQNAEKCHKMLLAKQASSTDEEACTLSAVNVSEDVTHCIECASILFPEIVETSSFFHDDDDLFGKWLDLPCTTN